LIPDSEVGTNEAFVKTVRTVGY